MTVAARGTRGLLAKIACLEDKGVSMTMPTEKGSVTGNALSTRSLAKGTANQVSIHNAVARNTIHMSLPTSHKRRCCRLVAGYAVHHGRRRCRIDLD